MNPNNVLILTLTHGSRVRDFGFEVPPGVPIEWVHKQIRSLELDRMVIRLIPDIEFRLDDWEPNATYPIRFLRWNKTNGLPLINVKRGLPAKFPMYEVKSFRELVEHEIATFVPSNVAIDFLEQDGAVLIQRFRIVLSKTPRVPTLVETTSGVEF